MSEVQAQTTTVVEVPIHRPLTKTQTTKPKNVSKYGSKKDCSSSEANGQIFANNDCGYEAEPCQVLRNRNSCMRKEIKLCLGDSLTPTSVSCNGMSEALSCLMSLNSICSTDELMSQLKTVEETNRLCASGDLENQRAECYGKVRSCTEEFHRLYNTERYEEARMKIEPARRCLDSITCANDGYADHEKSELDKAVKMYDSGALTGICNTRRMGTCEMIVYVGINSQHRMRRGFTQCKPENVRAAKNCMEELIGHCVTPQQRDDFKQYMEYIESARCYNFD